MPGRSASGAGRVAMRVVGALIGAPLVMAAGLTALVLVSALAGEPQRTVSLDRAREAALVFSQSLLAFNLTAGGLGVLLLMAAAERGLLAWAATGVLLGLVSATVHGVAGNGVVRDVELVMGGALGALDLLLVRVLAGIRPGDGPDQRPS